MYALSDEKQNTFSKTSLKFIKAMIDGNTIILRPATVDKLFVLSENVHDS